jgi:glutathione S-transferase
MMALTLLFHPLSSFCWKALIALYENGTEFQPQIIDLGDAASQAQLADLWPLTKFPVLRDHKRDRTVPETSIIIEYLQTHYPGPVRLLPEDAELCLEARLWDRFFDLYVSVPVQKIVGDRLRPEANRDPHGIADARKTLNKAYDMIERQVAKGAWAVGSDFTMADCAAAPALFYASILQPFDARHPALAAYFERLLQRPSVVRVLAEARPYFSMFPYKDAMPARFLRD